VNSDSIFNSLTQTYGLSGPSATLLSRLATQDVPGFRASPRAMMLVLTAHGASQLRTFGTLVDTWLARTYPSQYGNLSSKRTLLDAHCLMPYEMKSLFQQVIASLTSCSTMQALGMLNNESDTSSLPTEVETSTFNLPILESITLQPSMHCGNIVVHQLDQLKVPRWSTIAIASMTYPSMNGVTYIWYRRVEGSTASVST
jgi:hypothetical protein